MCKCHQYLNGDGTITTKEPESMVRPKYRDDDEAFVEAVVQMAKECTDKDKGDYRDWRARTLWGSLVNVVWVNDEKKISGSISFRAADELISDTLLEGTWYMSSPEAISTWVLDGMAKLGWRPESYVWHAKVSV